jgi:hypothetical protein
MPVNLGFTVLDESSPDTVFFDTVFTRMPGTGYPMSVNKQFLIKNPYNKTVRTNIILAGGEQSPYRINIDGVPGKVFQNVEILANDSIFGFVEVTLEANNQLHPVVIYDSIIFETNGNRQNLILGAYGWDAHYFRNVMLGGGTMIWDDKEKPFVLINAVAIDSVSTLVIRQGVKIYAAPETYLFVLGTLRVEGQATEPVVFQGDRLPASFAESQGQWGGIHFLRNSRNNVIVHAEIKNAITGIRVDSLSVNAQPKLDIRQTFIKNCSSIGLLGITADLFAENVAIANCGFYGCLGYFGGNYTFRHCTFASGYKVSRSQPSLVFNNVQRDENDNFVRSYNLSYVVENSIIYGNRDDELVLDLHAGTPPLLALFDHCVIKTDAYKEELNKNNNLLNIDPMFRGARENDLNIRSISPARGKGKALAQTVSEDLKGNPRNISAPAIGAYED